MKKSISAKAQEFAARYARSGNAKEAAINAGYSANTANVTGCKLLKDPRVKERIKEIDSRVIEDTVTEKSTMIESIEEIIELAKGANQLSAALKGKELICKMHGYFEPEKSEVEFKGGVNVNFHIEKFSEAKNAN